MTIHLTKPLDTRRPFTRKQALLSGLADDDLAGHRFRRIFHGIYVAADVEITVAVRARAALLVAPTGSYASHHTALLLWGGWAPPTSELHLSSPIRSTRSERRGVVAHVADQAVTPRRRNGVSVSPPARAFLELASTRPNLVDLVVAGDSLVTAGALSPLDLVAAADQWTGRWCRLARRAARLVRTGVNSIMESRVRMLIVLAGLPEPTTNHILRYPNGDWRRRLDLSYVGARITIEYDGRHHLNTSQRRSDLLRREELEREGWLFIVLVSEDVYDEPAVAVDRVRTALVGRGQHIRTHRLSPEWTRCFPGRPTAH
ncbi:MAG TPA: hypothetical protein VIT41_17710 [Microlunatus sp.]